MLLCVHTLRQAWLVLRWVIVHWRTQPPVLREMGKNTGRWQVAVLFG